MGDGIKQQGLAKRVDGIESRLGRIEVTMGNQTALLKEVKKGVDGNTKTLRGNNTSGMVSRVSMLERLQADSPLPAIDKKVDRLSSETINLRHDLNSHIKYFRGRVEQKKNLDTKRENLEKETRDFWRKVVIVVISALLANVATIIGLIVSLLGKA